MGTGSWRLGNACDKAVVPVQAAGPPGRKLLSGEGLWLDLRVAAGPKATDCQLPANSRGSQPPEPAEELDCCAHQVSEHGGGR